MSRYNPNPNGFRPIRDFVNPAEIAGHRPVMATRHHSEPDFEEASPRHSLLGQPDELYEDESYHHDMNTEKFNRQLRGGHSQEERDE